MNFLKVAKDLSKKKNGDIANKSVLKSPEIVERGAKLIAFANGGGLDVIVKILEVVEEKKWNKLKTINENAGAEKIGELTKSAVIASKLKAEFINEIKKEIRIAGSVRERNASASSKK